MIQTTHAAVLAQAPHAGTHTNTHNSTSVAMEMGIVPRNGDSAGSESVVLQLSGARIKCRLMIQNIITKNVAFMTKNMTDR